MKDYYQILGVPENASEEEIRRAFFELAKKYHPDRGGDEEKFKEINEAYQVLSNKEKRAQYDAQRKGQGFWFDQNFGESFDFFSFPFDLESIFEEDFFPFDFFRERRKPKKGKDVYLEISLTLKEAFFGTKKKIEYRRYKKCPQCQGKGYEGAPLYEICGNCNGSGKVKETKRIFFGIFSEIRRCPKCGGEGRILKNPCKKCKGEGRILEKETFEVEIEPGVWDGQLLKIKNKGDWHKEKPGDLFLKIRILGDEKFRRVGDDLYLKIPINVVEAMLGGKVEIENLDKEKLLIKIPPLGKAKERLLIKGKGMPKFRDPLKRRGDLIIEFEIYLPKKLSKKAKKLLEELRKEIS